MKVEVLFKNGNSLLTETKTNNFEDIKKQFFKGIIGKLEFIATSDAIFRIEDVSMIKKRI